MEKIGKEENLSERVLERIQKSIINRKFLPGGLLPSEKEMSAEYGVGKSSVREAIKMLNVLGVVESAQGKGTYLCKSIGSQIIKPLLYDLMLQESTANELYEFRMMFDIAYHHIAVQKATEEDKTLANLKFIEYKSLFEANLPVSDADIAFHRVILDATGNSFIIKIGVLIMELCSPYLQGADSIHNAYVMECHEKILNIFLSGDTKNLEDAIEGSMLAFREILDIMY
jgi:GntR family transcriptional repressor for pyruvate dehydrogenase complex